MNFEHIEVADALKLIKDGIDRLTQAFPSRQFTIDGRLVGDIGEAIAARDFDIILDGTSGSEHIKSRPHYDAVCRIDRRDVQIKATFKSSLTFAKSDGLYLGFKVEWDGSYRVIYNGLGQNIFEKYRHRSGIGKKLLSFPISQLELLNSKNKDSDRVRLK